MATIGFDTEFKTLQDRIQARDRISKETGHYWGIDKLTLRDEDPVKFDRFNSRLVAAVLGARETGKYVAASPAATGMGELVFGLQTREGDVPAGSLGLVGHNSTMPVVVESFARLGYDQSAGINHGDVWECNDPYYGAPHAADCFTFVPIIYKGRHIGWAGGVNHISEVGGLIPGAVPTVAPNVFVEGFDYPPLRSGQNDELFPWWENQWRRRTRLGDVNVLDAKMRMTGCLMLRDRILEVCEEFGPGYVIRGMAEVMERERATMEKRLRDWTMPGVYNFPLIQPVKYKGKLGLLFPEANKDWLLHFPLEVKLGNGRVKYDFSGASANDWHHYNMYYGSFRFGLNLAWYPVFMVGENMHTGNVYLMDFERPFGTVTNPSNPFVGTPSSAVMGCRTGNGLSIRIMSRALFGKGYLEETFCHEASDFNIYGMSGVFKDGGAWGMSNFSLVGAQVSAARAFMDGGVADSSGQNPETDYGESEEWEPLEPALLNIIRSVTTKDHCCHGKYRGGMGYTLAHMVNEPGLYFSANDGCAMNAEVTSHMCGSQGSYPGLGHASLFIRGTNMPELIAKGEYPGTFEEILQWLDSGKLTAKEVLHCKGETVAHPLKHGDLFVILAHHTEAWGDPLDRTAHNIEADLDRDLISAETALNIYGAQASRKNGKWKIDVAAMEKNRKKMRKQREEKSVPASQWWKSERETVVSKNFPEITYALFKDAISEAKDGLPNDKWSRKFKDFWALPQDYSL